MSVAITALILAAKLQEPVMPSYRTFHSLMSSEWNVKLELPHLLDLEEDILYVLDFDLQLKVGP
jgi:hypothetical protein